MTSPVRRRKRRTADAGRVRCVLYLRVSTDEQGRSGLSLDAQRATLTAEAERRGWEVAAVLVDEASAKRGGVRPHYSEARRMLRDGEADALMAARLDRVSRSVVDFSALMATATDEGWSLVLLDLGLDTTTTTGRMVAHILAAVAEAEREVIGQRTSAALIAKRRRGEHVGRRTTLPADVIGRIVTERKAGATLGRIADGLTADGIPTGQGGARWYPSTVSAVLTSQAAEALA